MMKRIVASFFLAFAGWLFAGVADVRPATQSYRDYAAIVHQDSKPIQLAQLGLPFPGPGMPASSGGGGISYTFTAAPTPIAGTANPTNFASVNIGTAAANRDVLVCVAQRDGGPTTAVAVGATNLTLGGQSSAGTTTASLWYGTITTGATATIGVSTTTAFATAIGIAVATINTSTPAPGTTQSETYTFSPDPQTTAAITVPSSGVGVLCGASQTPTGSPTSTWTIDASPSLGTTMQTIFGHISSTGSHAPSVSGYNNAGYGMVAAPWGP